MSVDLGIYNNINYNFGSLFKRSLWYFFEIVFFDTAIPYPNLLKSILLKVFGAKIGSGLIIKPKVKIKYPWFLVTGDNVWIGEEVWIDNLCRVNIGNNVCISQGAYIFTGNHNYKEKAFDLFISSITIEDGVWVGAKSIVCPGTLIRTHTVITVGTIINKETVAYGIYSGNPAIKIKNRFII